MTKTYTITYLAPSTGDQFETDEMPESDLAQWIKELIEEGYVIERVVRVQA